MENVVRWMLGGLVVFSLAACGPANGGENDDEDGTRVEQNEGGDDENDNDDN